MAFTVLLLMWYEYLCAMCVCVCTTCLCVGGWGFYFIFRQCEHLYVYTTIVLLLFFGGGGGGGELCMLNVFSATVSPFRKLLDNFD